MDQITEMLKQSKENIAIRYLPRKDYEKRKEDLILTLQENLSKLEDKKQEFMEIAVELLESKEKSEKTLQFIKKDLEKINTTIVQTRGYVSLINNNPLFRD